MIVLCSRLFCLLHIFFERWIVISKETTLINEQIRAKEVRVIDSNGDQLDIMPTAKAVELALSKGLDLVEVSPNSKPPVCKIMNYGKFKFDQSKKEKLAKKKQKQITVKEIKMRLGIEEHDFMVKNKAIEKFLKEGHKVKVTIMFRGRELNHPELGLDICNRTAEHLKEVANVERVPKSEGRNMIMILSPKSEK